MKRENKELLLKDLCARLPYQPLCKKVDTEDDFCECNAPLGYSLRDLVDNKITIKPYLRPMSSMTEEEKKEWHATFQTVYNLVPGGDPDNEDDYDDNWHEELGIESYDYLNAHHFDYRNLIEKGLAIEVTKENNPYKD